MIRVETPRAVNVVDVKTCSTCENRTGYFSRAWPLSQCLLVRRRSKAQPTTSLRRSIPSLPPSTCRVSRSTRSRTIKIPPGLSGYKSKTFQRFLSLYLNGAV